MIPTLLFSLAANTTWLKAESCIKQLNTKTNVKHFLNLFMKAPPIFLFEHLQSYSLHFFVMITIQNNGYYN
ncbi:hypothetical protein CU023_1679 [Enterococcus faecium]|nr:hypothetical protein [Enterococcus faecium]MBK4875060.1 hypothetical protein [Enterococcus faecium]